MDMQKSEISFQKKFHYPLTNIKGVLVDLKKGIFLYLWR